MRNSLYDNPTPMPGPLRILLLEDDPDDAGIIQHLLFNANKDHQIQVVNTRAAYIEALDTFQPDIVLSDNNLPGFSGTEALTIMQGRSAVLPFILVTGTLSDELAVNIIRLGADDYILKDRLTRLPSAIYKAIQNKKLESEKIQAAKRLAQSEAKYRTLFLKSPLPKWIYDIETLRFLEVNEAAITHYGYAAEEFLNMTIRDIRPKEDLERLANDIKQIAFEPDLRKSTWRHIKKNGQIITVETSSHFIDLNDRKARMVVINDITERINAEAEMQSMQLELYDHKVQAQKKMTRAMIKAQEQERNHIGRELHDNVNQVLTTAKLLLDMFIEDNPALSEPVKRPYDLIQNAIDEIRALTSGYVDSSSKSDLQDLIQKLLDTIRLTTDIHTSLVYKADSRKISNELKLNIYRIIQEQLSNIIKHANAHKIHIAIETDDDTLIVETVDDGKGFDVNAVRKGIGISNIINRVESFNGVIEIDSSPGKGARTWIKVPLLTETMS